MSKIHHTKRSWKEKWDTGEVTMSETWCGKRSIVESEEPYTGDDAEEIFTKENQCKKCLKAKGRET